MNNRIKFAGHTMGTPNCDIYQSIDLFKAIGYDGVEVRVATQNAQMDSETITDEEAKKIYDYARERNMEFACLTSYYNDFTSPDKRENTIKQLKRVVELAYIMHCPMIRLYGGVEPFSLASQNIWFAEVWNTSVSGIREVAKYAAKFGVKICIETHVGSLTMTVRDTVRIIEDVNMANVGMLLDYAWVELAGAEGECGADAIRKAARHIFHVHFKDWSLEQRLPIKKKSKLMGEGTVRWPEVLAALKEIGYTGYCTDEYEKFWYPEDLPDAEIGMKHNLEYVKKHLL